jgi:hypothetical protein
MSQEEDEIVGLLGDSYPSSWRFEITNGDESRLRSSYSISSLIGLRFAAKGSRVTVKEDDHEVFVYEDMFKAGFQFPFSRIVRELLHYLQITSY